ncbi:hypothetical protein ATI61_11461 [Archangium gephyra]|uniref:Uncharacterized protein n=1 Tax=Archangium gephyra TaxID=48 RepID=A0AAC8Q5G9_9BACT|nr:hypothetical protein [Archangium gephyra]AKJ01237.1 Hypothetical protein AA314_02863 [Archangium gephyra]REG24453.1 hypothetical protein ATI61_11461 [Archangium gephyra]
MQYTIINHLPLSLVASVLLACAAHAAPPAPTDPNDPVAVATQSLSTLGKLATQDTYAELGFQSLDEVGKAKLGSPVSVYMIRLDELKTLDPAADPKNVMHDLKERLFPVHVGGSTRTALVVRQDAAGKWKMASLGDAATVKLLDEVRSLHGKATGKTHEYLLVKVPAVYQMFLARTDGAGKMHLITLREDKAMGASKKGEERPANTVMGLLQKLARESKPLEKPGN